MEFILYRRCDLPCSCKVKSIIEIFHKPDRKNKRRQAKKEASSYAAIGTIDLGENASGSKPETSLLTCQKSLPLSKIGSI